MVNVLDGWIDPAWREALLRPIAEAFVERMQHGARSREPVGLQTRFSPYWESAALHFQRMVLATLEGRPVAQGLPSP